MTKPRWTIYQLRLNLMTIPRLTRKGTSRRGRSWTPRWPKLLSTCFCNSEASMFHPSVDVDHIVHVQFEDKYWSGASILGCVSPSPRPAEHHRTWHQENVGQPPHLTTILTFQKIRYVYHRYRLNHVFGLCEDPSLTPRDEELASRYYLVIK